MKPFLIFIFVSSAHSIVIDFDKMITDARKQNKQIMIFMHIPNCPYCAIMKKENFKDKETLESIKASFIFTSIGAKDIIIYKGLQTTYGEFAKKMKIPAFPATLFMKKMEKFCITQLDIEIYTNT